MKCPYCGSDNTKVIDSRSYSDGNSIKRRRECEECQKRFTTHEKVVDLTLFVIKKNGEKQLYSREKVYNGIIRAFEKRNINMEKIEEILDKLAIQNLKDKFPNQLSGGQRQRVATARALIDDSKLIIADEPTGALDSANSEKLMALLQEINKSFGITILLVTHDPAAAKYSSRMVLLSDGKIMDDLERNSLSNEQYLQEIYSRTR